MSSSYSVFNVLETTTVMSREASRLWLVDVPGVDLHNRADVPEEEEQDEEREGDS